MKKTGKAKNERDLSRRVDHPGSVDTQNTGHNSKKVSLGPNTER